MNMFVEEGEIIVETENLSDVEEQYFNNTLDTISAEERDMIKSYESYEEDMGFEDYD